jgi:hypothetical protein
MSQPLITSADPNPVFSNEHLNLLAAEITKVRLHQSGKLKATEVIPELASGASLSTKYINLLVGGMLTAQSDTYRLATPPAGVNSTIEVLDTPNSGSTPWNNTSTHTMTVEFDTADNMRYYFNTGGQIQFLADFTKLGTTTKNTSWTTLLKSIGIVSFGRSKTVSSKTGVSGTLVGYASLFTVDTDGLIVLVDGGKPIFSKKAPAPFAANEYRITAEMNTESSIIFTVEFIDGTVSTAKLPDIDVTGTLTSTIQSRRATGVNVEVPLPTVTSNTLVLGAQAPSYTITRSATYLTENEYDPGVIFSIDTVGVPDDTAVYWSIVGKNITDNDFNLDAMEQSSVSNIPAIIMSGTTDGIPIVAATDGLKEGLEKFDFIVRDGEDPATSVILTQLKSTAFEQIKDTSAKPTLAFVLPTFDFSAQTVTAFAEGKMATFVVTQSNMLVSTKMHWEIQFGDGDNNAADFGAVSGDFLFPKGKATYTLSIKLTGKDGEDPGETFSIKLYSFDDAGNSVFQSTSSVVAITDDFVAPPTIPKPSLVITGNTAVIDEGSQAGVQFVLTAPEYATNTKIYWRAIAANGITDLTDSDFSRKYVLGGVGAGGTASSYITIQSNKTATLNRYAEKDTATEGLESFIVEFYLDPEYQTFIIGSNPVGIRETVGWSIARTPSSANEGDGNKVTFNVASPYNPNGKLYWTIPQVGTIGPDDFNALSGEFFLDDASNGSFDVYPARDIAIEGPQEFQVQVRADSLAGDIKISSTGTITEPDIYIIDAISTVAEGGVINYSITTPYTPSGKLYWTTLSTAAGKVTTSDFTETPGEITITDSHGSLALHPTADNSTEGTESFKLVLHSGSIGGKVVYTQPEPIYITEVVGYTIALSNGVTSLAEGGNVDVVITTPYTEASTPLWWSIKGNLTTADYEVVDADTTSGVRARKDNGRVLTSLSTVNGITVSRASFKIYASNDIYTEGAETFKVYLHVSSDLTSSIKETAELSLTELVPWSMLSYNPDSNAAMTTVNEGDAIKFVVKTPFKPDRTALYWRAVSGGSGTWTSSQLDNMAGVIYTSKNSTDVSASVTVSPKNDKLLEGQMTFVVRIYELPSTMSVADINALSYSSVIDETRFRIESYPIIIYDTSQPDEVPDPAPMVIVSVVPTKNGDEVKSVNEGDEFQYLVTTTGVPVDHDLYWSLVTSNVQTGEILPSTTGASFRVDAEGLALITLNSVASANLGHKTILMRVRLTQFATKAKNGNLLTILKEQEYGIRVTPTVVREGNTFVVSVTTPVHINNPAAGSNLTWTIIPYASTNITAADFIDPSTGNPLISLSGTVSIGNDGTGSFSLTAVGTDATEGSEQFTITLAKNGIAIPNVPCPVVTITEDIGYSITSSRSYMIEAGTAGTNQVVFTVRTPKLSAATTLTYKVEQVFGTIRYTDFEEFSTLNSDGPLTGTVDIASQDGGTWWGGTITLTARADGLAEGSDVDQFKLSLWKVVNSVVTPIDASCSTVSIRESSVYSISITPPGQVTPNPTTVVTGTLIRFYVNTPQKDPGAPLYYRITGANSSSVTPNDFVETKSRTPQSLDWTAYVWDNATYFDVTPLTGNKAFTIELLTALSGGSTISAGTIPVITVTQPQVFRVEGSPVDTVYDGQTATFVITHPTVTSNTMYWKLTGTSGTIILPDDFTLGGTALTSLTGSKTNMTALGGQSTLVFGINSNRSVKTQKKFTLGVSLLDATPFVPVTNGTSNEMTLSSLGAFGLRSTATAVRAGETIYFFIKLTGNTTVKKIAWALSSASAYFTSASQSGIVDVPSNGNEVAIKLVANTTFTSAITTDVSFTLSLKEETASGTIITPSPTASVVVTGDYSISPNVPTTIPMTGVQVTFTAPSSDSSVSWSLVSGDVANPVSATWFTNDTAISGTLTRVTGLLPALNFTPHATNGKNGKKFTVKLVGSKQTLISQVFTMPAAANVPATDATIVTVEEGDGTTLTEGGTADIVISMPSTKAAEPVKFALKGDPAVIAVVQYSETSNAIALEATKPSGTVVKMTGVLYYTLSFRLTKMVPGSFYVEFTPPSGITTESDKIWVTAPPVDYIFYKDGSMSIPAGTRSVSVIMSGGGGQGGGMSVAFGGKGGDGDKIAGVLPIPEGTTSLSFKFIPGGDRFANKISATMGIGGKGGTAVELYRDGVHIATAAGGGGGGGGAVLPYPIMYPYTENPTVETVLNGTTTSKSTTRVTTAAAKAAADGAGAGGAPGGVSGIGTRSVQQVVYYNNDTAHRNDTNAKCATGGSGGISSINTTIAADLKLVGDGITSSTSRTVVYTPVLAKTWAHAWMNQYAIWNGSTNSSVTGVWDLVAITPPGTTTYQLTAGCDDYGFITINNKTIVISGQRGTKKYDVVLDASWNRKITVYAQNKNVTTTKNPYGVGATLALKSAPTIILWSTRSTATVNTADDKLGGGGIGGRGVASTSIPPKTEFNEGAVAANYTLLTPYTGGISGTPLSNSGEMGEPAYIQISLPPVTDANVVPAGHSFFISGGTNTFVVPAGISKVSIIAVGGGGGGGSGYDSPTAPKVYLGASGGGGGAGGIIECDLTVTSGETLFINVGKGGAGGTTGTGIVRKGTDGTTTRVTRGSNEITATGGQGGRGFDQESTSDPATANNTLGGESGIGSIVGPTTGYDVNSVVAPHINPGERGLADVLTIDLAAPKKAKTESQYYRGGNGANNGSKYGTGGIGGATRENKVVEPGSAGVDGVVLIYWGAGISNFIAPALPAIVAAKAVVPAARPAVVAPPLPAIDTVTYHANPTTTTGLGKYWAYTDPVNGVYDTRMYWENLAIPVVSGMTITSLGYDQTGTFTLYNSTGSTFQVPGQVARSTWPIPPEFGTIVKIVIYRANWAYVTAYISNQAGSVLWSTIDKADHFRTPTPIVAVQPINYVQYVQHTPTGSGINQYWVYPKIPWNAEPFGSSYWENLDITITTGMVMKGVGVSNTLTSFVLTNSIGNTVSITANNTDQPLDVNFGTIVRIQVIQKWGFVAGTITAGGVLHWSTLDIAQHNG